MDILLAVIAILCGVIGILGAVLPVLPGTPISYIGMVLLYFFYDGAKSDLGGTLMIVWLIISIAVMVIDQIVPVYFTKISGGSKAGTWASIIGMLVGMFFFAPLGMIIGAFLATLFAEMFIANKDFSSALKASFGSFLGFLVGTGIKLIAGIFMMYYIITALF